MRTLIYYEGKKILQKRSTWAAFLVLFAIQVFLSIGGNFGTTYVEGEVLYSHMERNRLDRENGLAISGRAIDQTLITELQDAYTKLDLTDPRYVLTDEYQNHAAKYEELYTRMNYWIAGQGETNVMTVDEDKLYEIRREQQEQLYASYGLTDAEIAYWQKQEEKLPERFTYQYAFAYDMLTSMSGGYMSLMLLTFFIAVTMGNVFVDEYTRKTGQIIQCTKEGRGRLYVCKMIAGSGVCLGSAVLFVIAIVIGNFATYGVEGFHTRVQLIYDFADAHDLTVGQMLLIMVALVALASILLGIITMVLAELMRNSIGALAIMVGGLFAVRLIAIPMNWRAVSQLWNLIPINLLKVDQGFLDLRLFSIGGLRLTTYQFAPFLYVLVGAVVCLLGGCCYCRNRD